MGVRAPYNSKGGADSLCSMFGGGVRRGVAGINNLPKQEKIILLKNLKNNLAPRLKY